MTQLEFIEEWPMQGRHGTAAVGATIGRTDCDIVLADPDVSRQHAVVRSSGDGIAIEDLGSTNGTFVNDERISRVTELKEGDTLKFGNTVWRVRGQPVPDKTHVSEAAPAEQTRISSQSPSRAMSAPAETPASRVASPRPADERSATAADSARERADSMPSAIKRALPAEPAAATARAFSPPAARFTRGSAARRIEAAVASYAVVLATAIAVAVYLIQR